jgi:sugar O-acyltransferase (sialic acid O-acetyltransferase NeuD family)
VLGGTESLPSGLLHPLQAAPESASIVIIGTGEQAALAFEYFTHDSPHEVVAFSAEPEFVTADEFQGLPVVPLDRLAGMYPPADYRAFVAVSSTQLNRVRRRLYDTVKASGYTCVSYVSSRAFVWHNVEIGENTFIFENNVLQHQVRVGDNVILWSGNHVGHQTVIEDDCFISSHVVISGFCRIGRWSYLGVNSSVNDELKLAEDCVIGAGAVVVKNTEPRQVYVGNPARATGRDSFAVFNIPGG